MRRLPRHVRSWRNVTELQKIDLGGRADVGAARGVQRERLCSAICHECAKNILSGTGAADTSSIRQGRRSVGATGEGFSSFACHAVAPVIYPEFEFVTTPWHQAAPGK